MLVFGQDFFDGFLEDPFKLQLVGSLLIDSESHSVIVGLDVSDSAKVDRLLIILAGIIRVWISLERVAVEVVVFAISASHPGLSWTFVIYRL